MASITPTCLRWYTLHHSNIEVHKLSRLLSTSHHHRRRQPSSHGAVTMTTKTTFLLLDTTTMMVRKTMDLHILFVLALLLRKSSPSRQKRNHQRRHPSPLLYGHQVRLAKLLHRPYPRLHPRLTTISLARPMSLDDRSSKSVRHCMRPRTILHLRLR